MLSLKHKNYLTSQEYLIIERKAEFKSEYFDGEMFAMAGASEKHAAIKSFFSDLSQLIYNNQLN
jgi:Uma2 family endonuclease